MTKKAVVLLSGGLDSATCVAIAQNIGFDVYGLSFRYGQRDNHEFEAAEAVAKALNIKRHVIIDIDLRAFGGSALTSNVEVPKGRSSIDMDHEIPVTYVPARNTIFLSFALAFAETLNSNNIFIGVNSLDYSGYPDCRPEYIDAFQKMAHLATKIGVEGNNKVKINTPLMNMTKTEIIKKGMSLGVDYSITTSCYDPGQNHFAGIGAVDPIKYQS